MFKKIVPGSILGIAVLTFIIVPGCKDCSTPSCAAKKSGHQVFDVRTLDFKKPLVPIVVVGSGPAGLSAGLYGAAQYDTVVLAGQMPSLLFETSYVDNWLGCPHMLGSDILDRAREQVASSGARFIDGTVVKIELNTWPYIVHMEDGSVIRALALIIATGARPRTLGVPGEREYWGKGVSACARCDSRFFKDKNVVVVGGGDAAIEEAIELARYARQVTILHRRNQLRAAVRMQTRLSSYQQIRVLYDVEVQEVIGDPKAGKVTGVRLLNKQTKKVETMPIDGFFLAIGHEPNTALVKDYLETDNQGYLMLESFSQQTSMQGVFAAGDVADPHYRQAIVAAGDGAKAAIDAINFLESIDFTLAEANKAKSLAEQQ